MKRQAPVVLLAAALLGSVVLTLVLTWEMTFFQDTWAILIERRDFTIDSVMEPHNEHIAVALVLIQWLFLQVFGMATAKPEFVLLAIGLAGTASLVFHYMRQRVGEWPALFAALILLCLGPAYEVLLWPFEIGYVGSIFFGLATLLALERNERWADILAAVCLAIALSFSSLGLPFVPGAAVAIALGERRAWQKRAFVVVVPVLLWVTWYLGWGHVAESHISLRNVFESPRFVVEAIALGLGSMVGLGAHPPNLATDPAWRVALLIALVTFVGYRQVIRRAPLAPGFWPIAAVAATNWFLTAFNYMPGRDPVASRYQYASAILILLLLANLFAGVRIGRGGIAVLGAVTLLALGPNLVDLHNGAKRYQRESVLTRSETAAIEIASRTVAPEFQLTEDISGTPSLVNVYAGKYLDAVAEYGSPAYSESELLSAPPEGRRQADVVLAHALPLRTTTTLGAFKARTGTSCVELRETGRKRPLAVTAGSTVEVAPGGEASLALGRFAPPGEFPVSAEAAPGGSSTALSIPRDRSPRPWRLQVTAEQLVRVCR